MSLSKSMIKAQGCGLYYYNYYIQGTRQVPSDFTIVGEEFHAYKQAYVNHLVEVSKSQDLEWVEFYLHHGRMCDETKDLIRRDSVTFEIDPEGVYGTEVFLALDSDFNQIEEAESGGPGSQPVRRGTSGAGARGIPCPARVHGTIDLLSIFGDIAFVDDYKSGWLIRPDLREAEHYALLVLCSFPWITKVHFAWKFARSSGDRKAHFDRDDLPYLKSRIITAEAIHQKIIDNKGKEINPFLGLCTYCTLLCPITEMARDKKFVITPAQTEKDARALMGEIVALRAQGYRMEKALEQWVGEHGPLEHGDYVAASEPAVTRSYPLRETMEILGLTLEGEKSPLFDVPLDRLLLRSSELNRYAKAKFREGMKEAIDTVAIERAQSKFRVRRKDEEAEEE